MRNGTTTILVGAVLLSAVWAGFSGEPEQVRQPYPLPVIEQAAVSPWVEQVEETFGLDRGLGDRAMTEQEWTRHQRKMSTLSPSERSRYQQQVRQRIAERLKNTEA